MRKLFILTSIVIGGILSSTPTTTYGTMPTGGSTGGGAPEVPEPYALGDAMITQITANNGLPTTGVGYVYFKVTDADKWKYPSTGSIVDIGANPSDIGTSVATGSHPPSIVFNTSEEVSSGLGYKEFRAKFTTTNATSGTSFSFTAAGVDGTIHPVIDDEGTAGGAGCVVYVN